MVALTNTISTSAPVKTLLNRFARDESAATVIEYGLIAGLISIVIVIVIGSIGTALRDDVYGVIVTALGTAVGTQ